MKENQQEVIHSVPNVKKSVKQKNKPKKINRQIYQMKKTRDLERRKKKRLLRLQNKKNRELQRILLLKKMKEAEHSFFSFINDSEFYSSEKFIKFRRNAVIKIPKIFSLIEAPDEALKVYKQIYSIASKREVRGIYFDHSECEVLEIGASTVMDVFVINLERYLKIKGRKLNFSGKLPPDEKNKIALYVSGLLKHLEVTNIKMSKQINRVYKGIKTLELISGGKNTPTYRISPNAKSDDTQTKVVEYFSSCLETQDIGLNEEGMHFFLDLIGEAINNCELHSGEFCQWFTLGHYWMQESYGECNIVLFNFGQTIYEGLKNSISSKELKESLELLSKEHNKKGFFNKGNDWDEETLWTLYSLQDGVSRCRSDDEPDRGTGTVKLIDAFQQIGDTFDGKKAKMSIISGRACIYFDGEYKLLEKDFDYDSRQIIAFNKENDLFLPPDKRYVKKNKNFFPGTVISMQFYLDKKFLEDIIEGGNYGD